MTFDIETIEDLGYDDFFEESRVKLGLSDFCIARVITEYKGLYKVKSGEHEYLAGITGKKSFTASAREDYPAIGDWVALDKVDGEKAVIHEILARKTTLERKYSGKDETQLIATNIDVAFIVESIDRDFNLNRFERYCAMARNTGITPVAILNKIELISEEERSEKMKQIKERIKNIDIFFTSTVTGEGVEMLKNYTRKGKTYCFLGSSGVGKSSLINKLLGENRVTVGAIGEHSNRGKHITTQREMYFLDNGGIVIDNPGIREVGITDIDTGVDDQFDAISFLADQCKYSDCTHTHEPGCKVLEDVQSGDLDEDEYDNYISLKKESDYYGMTKREKKQKDKKFGKFIKTTKSDLKRYGHKDYDAE